MRDERRRGGAFNMGDRCGIMEGAHGECEMSDPYAQSWVVGAVVGLIV